MILSIWWSTDGSLLSGTQPFKAGWIMLLLILTTCTGAWMEDKLNLMSDNTTGGDHKETSVDLSG